MDHRHAWARDLPTASDCRRKSRRENRGNETLHHRIQQWRCATHRRYHCPAPIISASSERKDCLQRICGPLVTTTEPYLLAGFRAYSVISDGANHNFGDTSVSSDIQQCRQRLPDLRQHGYDAPRPRGDGGDQPSLQRCTDDNHFRAAGVPGTAHLRSPDDRGGDRGRSVHRAAGGLWHSTRFRIFVDADFAQLEREHHRYLLIAPGSIPSPALTGSKMIQVGSEAAAIVTVFWNLAKDTFGLHFQVKRRFCKDKPAV